MTFVVNQSATVGVRDGGRPCVDMGVGDLEGLRGVCESQHRVDIDGLPEREDAQVMVDLESAWAKRSECRPIYERDTVIGLRHSSRGACGSSHPLRGEASAIYIRDPSWPNPPQVLAEVLPRSGDLLERLCITSAPSTR